MEPITRSEQYLASIIGEDVVLPVPQSRIEHYLNIIAQNGISPSSAGLINYDPEAEYPEGSMGAGLQAQEAETGALKSAFDDLDEQVQDIYPVESASGDIASFADGAGDVPLKSLTVQIKPVQNLHGYDKPWPAGGGKNLLNPALLKDEAAWNVVELTVEPSTQYTVSSNIAYSSQLLCYANNTGSAGGGDTNKVYTNHPVTLTSTADGKIYLPQGKSGGDDSFANHIVMVEKGSTGTALAPYSNICPITGWDGVKIWVQAEYDDTADPTVDILIPTPPGTVYGGTLNLTTGVLSVDRVMYTLDGVSQYLKFANEYTSAPTGCKSYYIATTASWPRKDAGNYAGALSSHFYRSWSTVNSMQAWDFVSGSGSVYQYIFILPDTYSTLALANQWLADQVTAGTPVQVLLYRETPVTYQLTPQEVKTLLGQNNIWADTGDVSIEYRADVQLYVDKKVSASQTLMELIITANRESGMTASAAYSAGALIIVNGTLYKATTSIASGATLTVGTNVTATTIAAELAAL